MQKRAAVTAKAEKSGAGQRSCRWFTCCLLLTPLWAQAEPGRYTLQPESLAEDMFSRPWHSQARMDFPALERQEPAARPARHIAWGTPRGWQFSLELRPPRQIGYTPGAAPPGMSGSQPGATMGQLLSGGMQRSFGDWTVKLNMKQQHSLQYGSFRKPAISLLWQPEGTPMVAGLALSRTTSTGFYSAGNPLGGNAQASPEKRQQAELYFTNADRSRWRTRLSLFQAYYRDMMDFDGGPPPSLINRARVYMRGMEGSLSHRWDNGSQAYLHLATIASHDPDTGVELRFRPQRQATGGFSMPVAGPLHLHASLTWFGQRVDSTGVSTSTGGSTEAGLMLSWKTKTDQAFLAIDNLTGRRSEELIEGTATGRRVRLGWRLNF